MATLDLRPLSLGELLDRTFFLYRRNFLLFLGIGALPYSLLLVVGLAFGVMAGLARMGGGVPSGAAIVGGVVGGLLILVAALAFFVALLFSVGATVLAVAEIYSGHRPTIRGSFRLVRGKAGAIFGVMFLSLLIMIAGFIALVIPGIYLMCRIPVATAATVVEDLGPVDGIGRSFGLTRGFAGRSAMIYLLIFALSYGVALAFQLPFYILIALSAKQPQIVLLWTVLLQVSSLLGSLLVTPVNTIAFAVFYYDLRVRKEAFDLQMMMQAIGGPPVPPAITGGVPSMFGRDAS